MRKFVARLSVSVALIAAAAPALASSAQTVSMGGGAGKTASYVSGSDAVRNGYWTASSEYYYSSRTGRSSVSANGQPARRILITGYHPVEGFGPELAKEAENAAR